MIRFTHFASLRCCGGGNGVVLVWCRSRACAFGAARRVDCLAGGRVQRGPSRDGAQTASPRSAGSADSVLVRRPSASAAVQHYLPRFAATATSPQRRQSAGNTKPSKATSGVLSLFPPLKLSWPSPSARRGVSIFSASSPRVGLGNHCPPAQIFVCDGR